MAGRAPHRSAVLLAAVGLVLLAACAQPLPRADPRLPGPSTTPPVETGADDGSPASRFPVVVQVASAELRPEPHPEDAAVRYDVRLANNGNAPVVVEIDTDQLSGRDDRGEQYEDYWSQAERNNRGCTCTGCRVPDYGRLTRPSVTLAPGASSVVTMYLSRAGVRGDCQRSGRARTRIPPGTNRIDVSLPALTLLNADRSPAGSLPRITLRLDRKP